MRLRVGTTAVHRHIHLVECELPLLLPSVAQNLQFFRGGPQMCTPCQTGQFGYALLVMRARDRICNNCGCSNCGIFAAVLANVRGCMSRRCLKPQRFRRGCANTTGIAQCTNPGGPGSGWRAPPLRERLSSSRTDFWRGGTCCQPFCKPTNTQNMCHTSPRGMSKLCRPKFASSSRGTSQPRNHDLLCQLCTL